MNDFRFGARRLWRDPGFTTTAVLALALGIAATTVAFSLANAVVLRPLPFSDPERLMVVLSTSAEAQRPYTSAPGVYLDWKEQTSSFETLAGTYRGEATWQHPTNPRRIGVGRASFDFFDVLGVQPILGRTFTPEDDQSGRDDVVLIDEGFWRRELGGAPDILGRSIVLSGRPLTIVGVLPANLRFADFGILDVWAPLAARRDSRTGGSVIAVGRLRPGVTPEAAQSEMDAVMERIREAYPLQDGRTHVFVGPLRDWIVGDAKHPLAILVGTTAFLLLIGCTNVGNLLLARSTAQRHEMAVRASLGAGRLRLVRQCLAESTLLACAGGVAGAMMASLMLSAVVTLDVLPIPRLHDVSVDASVLAIAAAVTLGAGVLAALPPAIRTGRRDVWETLRRSAADGRAGNRTRYALLAAQIALAVILLSGAGLMLNSVVRLLQIDLGFDASTVAIRTNVPGNPACDPSSAIPATECRTLTVNRRLAEEISRMPGVEHAAVADRMPLENVHGPSYLVSDDGVGVTAEGRLVDPGYFAATGIPVLAGRELEPADDDREATPALINQTAARMLFGDGFAIGRTVNTLFDGQLEVVGVVGESQQLALIEPPGPQIYLPVATMPGNAATVVVRTRVNPTAMFPAFRAALARIDPSLPPPEIQRLRDRVLAETEEPRVYAALLAIFAGLALVLATVGVYGVTAYVATRRMHELGIRTALGATPLRLVQQTLAPIAVVTLLGAVIGIAGALGLTRALKALLYEVQPGDPLTLGLAGLLLLATTLAAACAVARRAALADPTLALKVE